MQKQVMEQVRRCLQWMPLPDDPIQYEHLVTHVLEEAAESMQANIDVPACLAQLDITSFQQADDQKEESMYSPLAVPNRRYPSVPQATEQRVWEIIRCIHHDVLTMMDYRVVSSLTEEEMADALQLGLQDILALHDLCLNQQELTLVIQFLLDDLFHFGPLEPLLHDESVSDILVNGPYEVFVERHGVLQLCTIQFRDDAHLTHLIKKIASETGRRIDFSSPYVDARLPDGSRVNAVLPPISIDKPLLSIRRFSGARDRLDSLVANASLTPTMAAVLSILVKHRLNVIISGGTGSGKTTLLNALSWAINQDERLVTIEDAAELQLNQPHVLRLETRQMGAQGEGLVTQKHLVVNALRMRPDRILLGEVRGGEAFDMLQAMNVGHDGSMTTLHANSPEEAIRRLISMVMMSETTLTESFIQNQVLSVIDLIIQVGRVGRGQRRVLRITSVGKQEDGQAVLQDLFHFEYHDDATLGRHIGQAVVSPAWLQKIHDHQARSVLASFGVLKKADVT